MAQTTGRTSEGNAGSGAGAGSGSPGGRRGAGPRAAAWLVGLVGAALAGLQGGCEMDSFIDPSVVGRWEMTPTVVPILDRIHAIEGPEEVYVEYTEVETDDLVPELTEYRIGPGDTLAISIRNFTISNVVDTIERRVDSRGYVALPQVGSAYIDGMTLEQANTAILDAVRPVTGDTDVDVLVLGEQQRTFSMTGVVGGQGPYFVPYADYRLMDAIAAAGGLFTESVDYVYVIRQVALTDEATGRTGGRPATPAPSTGQGSGPGTTPRSGENVIDVIDDLLDPAGSQPPSGSPGAMSGSRSASAAPVSPATAALPIALIENAQPGGQGGSQPAVSAPPSSSGQWLYLDGEWVLVSREGGASGPDGARQLFTQRVIRIPVRPLLAGDARYNIVIRPNDIVRVPPPPQGNIFLAGKVARPGTFGLAPRLTLTRAVVASGGLAPDAVPERTDLVRMVGPAEQATMRLNLRAIFEGTQPDIFLKENDVINVGTNFWAYPLAVIRGGFRFSYGFGFLLDRNFGNDVFGAPPGTFR
ncbi:MAG: polysaccharide biosynthesis/export family protein [Phycisphaerales bacterium]